MGARKVKGKSLAAKGTGAERSRRSARKQWCEGAHKILLEGSLLREPGYDLFHVETQGRIEFFLFGVDRFAEGFMRPMTLLSEFLQDLRYGARVVARQPGTALIIVISLALGIGANTMVFSLVNAVLFRDQLLNTVFGDNTTSMATYGIQTDRYGKLVFDATKFQTAYAADPAGTAAKFTSGATPAQDGWAARVSSIPP